MKNKCDVVRDLIPLVLDRVASDDSRELVEEHIGSCDECRKQYEEMKAGLPEEERNTFEAERERFVNAMKSIRSKRMKRRIISLAVVFVCCAAAIFIGGFAYDALFNRMSVPVDNSLYSLSVCRLRDGSIAVNSEHNAFDFDTTSNGRYVKEAGQGVQYVTYYTAPIHAKQNVHGEKTVSPLMLLAPGGDEPLSEIRQGTPENYITVWKKGEDIPAASEEMEAFFKLEEMYWEWFEQQSATSDGKMLVDHSEDMMWQDRLSMAYDCVPEWN